MIPDVMQKVYPLVDACDTMVMASPLYFWTFSSQIKAFMDRLFAISSNHIYPKKDVLLLMTADDDSNDTFRLPPEYHQFITAALGWQDIGNYLAGGCSGEPGRHAIPDAYLEKAYELGRALQ